MARESEIIAQLRKRARVGRQVLVGIGDDAAVINGAGGKDLIACCDLLTEGIHFQAEWMPARLLGRKALAVNLSDVAAMGGVPRFAMISVAIPRKYSSEFIDELFGGVFELAEASGVSIIGGDTSGSRDSLFVDVSVLGECESGRAVTRGGAKPGDAIYVTGSLGASALGLFLLESGFNLNKSEDPSSANTQAVLKHLCPNPQLKLGRAIGDEGVATAMIDISDGLSTDLGHICDESGCGAIILAGAIPIAECVKSLTSESEDIDPLALALHGGEEYELLFTARPENQRRIEDLSVACEVAVTSIGNILPGRGLQMERDSRLEPLPSLGYEHQI
ncbi:MAG TPA: thiamine-phosphate kinase [Blastocatellia bacterium]|jgi:thiamine-monophosphate kinase